jgi:hypothetical protein
LLGAFALLGCGSRSAATRAAPAAEPAAVHAPAFTFVAPQAWHSTRAGVAPIDAPDLARETWRALVNQNEPIQAKTPRWQALPADQTVALQMPAGSAFRCIVSPLQISAHANTLGSELKAWLLSRRVLCSSDDWRSWTESTLRARQPIGAARDAGEDAGLLLREQAQGGSVHQTFVLLRSDPEKREATTGPPRVIDGVALDDD